MSQIFPNGGGHLPSCPARVFPGQLLDYYRQSQLVAPVSPWTPASNHYIGGADWTTTPSGPDDLIELWAQFDFFTSGSNPSRFITGEWFVNGVLISEEVSQIYETLGGDISIWGCCTFKTTHRTPFYNTPLTVRLNMRWDSTAGATTLSIHAARVFYTRRYLPRELGIGSHLPVGGP